MATNLYPNKSVDLVWELQNAVLHVALLLKEDKRNEGYANRLKMIVQRLEAPAKLKESEEFDSTVDNTLFRLSETLSKSTPREHEAEADGKKPVYYGEGSHLTSQHITACIGLLQTEMIPRIARSLIAEKVNILRAMQLPVVVDAYHTPRTQSQYKFDAAIQRLRGALHFASSILDRKGRSDTFNYQLAETLGRISLSFNDALGDDPGGNLDSLRKNLVDPPNKKPASKPADDWQAKEKKESDSEQKLAALDEVLADMHKAINAPAMGLMEPAFSSDVGQLESARILPMLQNALKRSIRDLKELGVDLPKYDAACGRRPGT